MNQIMTPSVKTTTTQQIDKAVANYRAMLEKHAPHFASTAVQWALGLPVLAKVQSEVFRTYVEAVSKTVIRFVKVDRARTPKQAIDATRRVQYVDADMLAMMPVGTGGAEAIFVNLGHDVYCDKLDDELGKIGFKLIVDPQGLAAINEDDPAFADERPNCTQWKDQNGNYWCMIFGGWYGERSIGLKRCDQLGDDLWFPCCIK